jgi:DNA polymerase III epsilon subunit-like protein
LPDSYAVIDTETTGVDVYDDFVVEFGMLPVQNRQILAAEPIFLNWYACPQAVDPAVLTRKLEETAALMHASGRCYLATPERVQQGVHPQEFFANYLRWLVEVQRQNVLIAGHHFYKFDRTMLATNARRLGIELPHVPVAILDTGLFEKAAETEILPWPENTLYSWYDRVNAVAAAVSWNLDRHCATKYALLAGLDAATAHTTQTDTQLCARLVERFREFIHGNQQA